jgi:antitoxin ParD1/3/4
MSGYRFTPQAADDLVEIWRSIAQDNSEPAGRVEAAVFRACDLIAKSRLAGQTRRNVTPLPVRFWVVHPYPNYVIVYNPDTDPMQIIRILHGARDLPSILR